MIDFTLPALPGALARVMADKLIISLKKKGFYTCFYDAQNKRAYDIHAFCQNMVKFKKEMF